MQTELEYPFFTRFGTIQLTAWLSDSVCCDVLVPQSYYFAAHIKWTRQKYENCQPNLSNGEDGDVIITREEFMVGYHAAEAFQAEAELEFLGTVAVAPCNSEQAKEITRLASHPLLNIRIRTRALLAIPRLTKKEASEYIAMLVAAIAVLEGPVEYAVTGEAFTVKAA